MNLKGLFSSIRRARGPGVIAGDSPMAQALVELARGERSPATDTPDLLAAERSNAYERYNGIVGSYVPWLLRKIGRSGLIVEIGCGSGASTAAYAQACDRLVALDVDPVAVGQTNARLKILGLANAQARTVAVGEMGVALEGEPCPDGFVFHTVLDRVSHLERRVLLEAAWSHLRPGGFILIGETRNAVVDGEPLDGPSRGLAPGDLVAAFGADYADHLISSPDDAEIAHVFGDSSVGMETSRARARDADVEFPPSLTTPFLSLLLIKPGAKVAPNRSSSPVAVPSDLEIPPVTRRADVAAVRAFARDPANFDAFAEIMCEALGPQVYLNWEHDAPYKRHFRRWQKAGFTVLPNHYYSPVPDMNELSEEQLTARYPLIGVPIDEEDHRRLLKDLKSVEPETTAFRSRNAPTTDGLWYSGGAFGLLDAQVAYAMVRTQKPRRIIEIGTGFSTLAMAEACTRNRRDGHPVEFTTIDPFPSFAVSLKPDGLTRNITRPVESLPLTTFEDLEAGDILFIDSTHIIRPGGDVEYEYFQIIPRLKPGVWIHVHDIFFPLSYPPEWARDRHIFWNEQQLLMAFLTFNHSFRAKMALSAASDRWIDAVKDAFPGTGDRPGPGSFWMQRIA